MTDPNTPGFSPGGLPDRVDNRDYNYSEIGFGTAPFDWSTGFDIEIKVGKLPVKDQNGSFSCGGQAWSNYAGVLEAVASGTLEERSAKFFYSQTYQVGGGSTGRDNADIYVNQGAAREAVLSSYAHGLPPDESFITRSGDITDAVRQDAKSDTSISYAQVEPASIDSNAQAIRDNNGVILLLDGQNNGTWASAFPLPPTTTAWRHWVYAGKAKMINGKKYIGILNSWGDHIGENGWQYLGEEYFTSGHVLSGWTHVLAPLPSPFAYKFLVDIHYGDNGTEVVALQKVLQTHGFFPSTVPTSGFYGEVTRRAVLALRVKSGVSSATDPLGKVVGPLTRAALNKL